MASYPRGPVISLMLAMRRLPSVPRESWTITSNERAMVCLTIISGRLMPLIPTIDSIRLCTSSVADTMQLTRIGSVTSSVSMPCSAAATFQFWIVAACISRLPIEVQMGARPSRPMISALDGLPIAP